ncbi:sigma-70 family RNA polymerase sigma factor [Catenuloplanes sp. NPDC051500]|uniref:sigma-70 family RNA polymerase sigma factor n=1 Tax=Catenuloplanes sp. NPDC051500 TaxID=3363959 RepID=UPI0037BA59D1
MQEKEQEFTAQVAPLRRELLAHCYRMLGSVHDAEDALQDALLRAWRGLAGFEGRSSLRSWLYTVATRTCLDAAEARSRRALPMDLGPAATYPMTDDRPRADVAWLGPFPSHTEAGYEQREAVELAFVAALQHLPGNQRAALILFDVLDFSAAEIAEMMATSVTSVNSALSRARGTLATRVPAVSQQRTARLAGDARLRETVAAFSTALERGDADLLVSRLTDDVTWSMPPLPHWYEGLAAVTGFAVAVPLSSCGEWRHSDPLDANGQPAVASYRQGEPWSINVFTMRDDRICAITSFIGAEHFTAFGLPASWRPRAL